MYYYVYVSSFVNCTLHFLVANNVLYFPTDVDNGYYNFSHRTLCNRCVGTERAPKKLYVSYAMMSALICFLVIIILH